MSNIIKKVGSAIAKNREATKEILTKHQIAFGAGKNSDLILAAFKAIKSGNKEVAVDLAGLIELNKAKTPKEKEDVLARIKSKVEDIKSKIKGLLSKIKDNRSGDTIISADAEVAALNADGDVDPIESNASEIIASVNSSTPELLSKEAMNGILIGVPIVFSLVVLAVIVGMIFGVGKLKHIG